MLLVEQAGIAQIVFNQQYSDGFSWHDLLLFRWQFHCREPELLDGFHNCDELVQINRFCDVAVRVVFIRL